MLKELSNQLLGSNEFVKIESIENIMLKLVYQRSKRSDQRIRLKRVRMFKLLCSRNFFATTFVSVSIITIWSVFIFKTQDFQPRSEKLDVCPENAIVLHALGRSGNKLWEFWGAYISAVKCHRDLYIQTSLQELLRTIFDHQMIFNRWNVKLLSDCYFNKTLKQFTFNELELLNPSTLPDPILLSDFPSALSVNLMKEIFAMRPQFWAQMPLNAQLSKNAQILINRARRFANQTIVGIHVRRTDYELYLNNKFGPAKMANADYFARAKFHFRAKYHQPLFIVSSDDMEWCKSNLEDADTVFLGNENQDSPELDFALLSLSDHLILTYGTFGFSAAYYCKGEVLVADQYTRQPVPMHEKLRQVKPPKWTFLRV